MSYLQKRVQTSEHQESRCTAHELRPSRLVLFLSFLDKTEALDELIREKDAISQVLKASSVHIIIQELLEYVFGICRANRIRAIVPTVIIQDQNGLDGIIDRICLDNSLRRRAQSLQPDEAAEFMSRLVEVCIFYHRGDRGLNDRRLHRRGSEGTGRVPAEQTSTSFSKTSGKVAAVCRLG